MIPYERPIRFEEVDAAGIVFFARFLNYAHEAMEHFFAGLPGGYAHFILQRHTGFPAVDVHMSFKAPVKYGEVLRIETSTARLGNRSATLRYRMFRKHDDVLAAEVEHTIVMTNLQELVSCPMPDDVRAIFSEHLEKEAGSG
jgi:4-hydroxybenzoyl-CoA thioesterase